MEQKDSEAIDDTAILLEEEARGGGASGAASISTALAHNTLETLLGCCDSIVRTCLSHRTITPFVLDRDQSRDADCRTTSSSLSSLQLERQVARWLDAKIFEAERHLHVVELASATTSPAAAGASPHRQLDAASSKSASDSTRTVQELQQELWLRTSQLQLEHRFLSRGRISKQAQRENRQSFHLDDDRLDNESDDVRKVQHGAIKARDRQVSQARELEAELSNTRKLQRETKDETLRLQSENRKLRDAIRAAESEKQRQQASSDSGARPQAKEVENRVLEQLLRDLVLGSSLDWFADDRLRDMVTRKNLP